MLKAKTFIVKQSIVYLIQITIRKVYAWKISACKLFWRDNFYTSITDPYAVYHFVFENIMLQCQEIRGLP